MRRLLAPILGVLACGLPAAAQSNVLLIVADDVGVDMIGAYAEHPNPANTPSIDALAADGLLFRNCWANPVCSTTRATILTGRYSFRTGIGRGIAPNGTDELPASETTLAELFAPTHETWAVGKWHLSADTAPMTSPQTSGFDHHWGTPSNIHFPEGDTYYSYGKNIDGSVIQSSIYATTDTVDDAIALVNQASGPWFMYLSFNSAHAPWHAPPSELHSYDLPPNLNDDLPNTVRAMVEAMDTELGRLLAAIPQPVLDDTLIVFVGDNGTSIEGTVIPFNPNHAKGTVYEGGVNVPLIMVGPGIPVNDKCKGIAQTTDLFATICEVMGIPQTTATDSTSLVPYFSDPNQPNIQTYVYTEWFDPNGFGLKTTWNRAIRDWRFKLIQRFDQTVDPFNPYQSEFYDLNIDPFEQFPLNYPPLPPLHEISYLQLHQDMLELHGPWVDMGSPKAGSTATPVLTGGGVPTANEQIVLTLTDAPPNTVAYLLYGIQQLNLPYLSGNIVPDFAGPGGGLVILPTDGLGQLTVGGPMPLDTPIGLPLYFQYWIDDPAASFAVAASNAVGTQTR